MINRKFCRSKVNTNVHNVLGAKVVNEVTNALKAEIEESKGYI